MSVRAYKVITRSLAKEPSFNVWEESWWLYSYFTIEDNVEFMKEDVEEALKVEKDEHRRGVLSTILLDCGKDDFVEYECF